MVAFMIWECMFSPNWEVIKNIFKGLKTLMSQTVKVSFIKATVITQIPKSDKAIEIINKVFDRFTKPVLKYEEFSAFMKGEL